LSNTKMANQTSYVSMSDVLFAKDWDLDRTISFMGHWVPTSFKITVGYLLMVYFGQKVMARLKPLDGKVMDYTLAGWNFMFSIFSGFAAYRLIPELFSVLKNMGFVPSYCTNANYYTDPYTGYWGWMFVMSKAPELGDTLFLILRKRPVIFMHWYHHALTFLYAQITYAETQAWCRWSLALNLTVHTVMYCYFGIRALHINTPKPVAKFITTIQIIQFVISCYIFAHLVIIKTTNSIPSCAASWNVLGIGGLMYLSYLYLFGQFFYNAYIAKRHPGKTKKVE
jgi:elongation of very long chain fatty acids protein 6